MQAYRGKGFLAEGVECSVTVITNGRVTGIKTLGLGRRYHG